MSSCRRPNCRLCAVPAALDSGRKHLPATVLVRHQTPPTACPLFQMHSNVLGLRLCHQLHTFSAWCRTAMQRWRRADCSHRNCMGCEFMGLIRGEYEAKRGGFLPGGAPASLKVINAGWQHRPFRRAFHLPLHPSRNNPVRDPDAGASLHMCITPHGLHLITLFLNVLVQAHLSTCA